MIIQVMAPTEPARLVLKIAMAALSDAAKQDPPLNPSQPTQRRAVPRTMELVLGIVLSFVCAHVPNVGWLEDDSLGAVSSSSTDKVRVRKTTDTGSDLDWDTTSVCH